MSIKRYSLKILALVFLLAIPQFALADARIEARRHFYRALAHIQAERMEDAIEEFKKAYELLPRPAVLYNIGKAYYDIGNEREALAYFQQYLDTDPPGDQSEVRGMVVQLDERIRDRERREAEAVAREEALEEDEALMLLFAPQIGAEVYAETVAAAGRFDFTALDSPSSTTIISSQEIRLSGLNNIPEILRRAAGVDVAALTASDNSVSIRGLNQRLSNKVLVLIDGRSVYLDFLGAMLWSLLPVDVEDIERIEVIRGPASAVHGADAFTGIVNIVTREPGTGDTAVASALGNANVGRATARTSGSEGIADWTVSGGYQQGDHFSLALDPDRVDVESPLKNPSQGINRTWLKADLALNPGQNWNASVGSGVFAGDFSFVGIGRQREILATDVMFAQSYAQVDTPIGVSFSAFWNALRNDAGPLWDVPGAAQTPTLDLVTDIVDFETVYKNSFNFVFDHDLALGAGYRRKSITWNWLEDEYVLEHHMSAFFENTMRPREGLLAAIGGRIDRHPLMDGLQASPRGSLIYRPATGHAVRGFMASAFRSPTFLESYIHYQNPTPVRGASALGIGNSDLRPEGIRSMEIGYVNQSTEWVEAEANIFYNRVVDQIAFARIHPYRLAEYPGYEDEVDAFPMGELQFVNEEGVFRQIGLDAGAKFYPVRGFDAYLNYAIHDTSPMGDVDVGARELDRRTSRHKINAGFALRPAMGMELSLDLHWSSSQVWVEQIVDSVRGVTLEPFELPGFALVNARIGQRFFRDQMEVSLAAYNLLGHKHLQHPFGQTVGRRIMASTRFSF